MPEPKRMSPNSVDGFNVFVAIVGKMEIDQDQACESDRDVEEKDIAPMQVTDDEAAGDGPQHGRHQGGDGDEAHNSQ